RPSGPTRSATPTKTRPTSARCRLARRHGALAWTDGFRSLDGKWQARRERLAVVSFRNVTHTRRTVKWDGFMCWGFLDRLRGEIFERVGHGPADPRSGSRSGAQGSD